MTAVFAAQGWGNFGTYHHTPQLSFLIITLSLAAALVALIVTAAYKDVILASPSVAELQGVDTVWRLLIGLGCVPGAVALYFRLTIPETPRFTMDIERNIDQASTDIENVLTGQEKQIDEDAHIQRIHVPKASWSDFIAHFGQLKNFKLLFGASYSWFALDVRLKLLLSSVCSLPPSPQIAFYGLGLNSSIILTAIGFGGPFSSVPVEAIYQNLKAVAIGNLILSAAGLIPGYYVSFILIDSWGRKPIQLMGFILLTIIFIIMGMCLLITCVPSFLLDVSFRLCI